MVEDPKGNMLPRGLRGRPLPASGVSLSDSGCEEIPAGYHGKNIQINSGPLWSLALFEPGETYLLNAYLLFKRYLKAYLLFNLNHLLFKHYLSNLLFKRYLKAYLLKAI